MTKETLKLALEFIERVNKDGWILADFEPEMYATITAIKEALAQPERDYERGFIDGMQKQMQSSVDKAVNRMAQTQEPVALPCCGYVDASAVKWNPHNQVVQCHNCGQVYTTPPQSEQKPVAWFSILPDGKLSIKIVGKPTEGNWEPLYTTPPQRTWQGLTHEEIDYIYTGIRAVHHEIDSDVFARAIEAKLKEKNT
jgi:transcription elongation factor Elf1